MSDEVLEKEMPLAEWKKARNEGTSTSVVEEKEEESNVEEQQEEKVEEKPKQKGWNGAQKKIDRLVKHNAEIEKRAEAAEKRAAELEAKAGKQETEKPKAPEEPKREEFEDDPTYYRALARWEVKQEFLAQAEADEKAQEDARTKEIFDTHNNKVTEARAKYDDFDESVTTTDTPWKDGSKSDVQASQAFAVALFESGNGGEILYYLSKHKDELEKMHGLSPARVQMAVGRIADKLEATKVEPDDEEEEEVEEEEKPEPKKLPTPIKPVGRGTSTSSKKLDEMPLADFKKARNAGQVR